MVLLTLCAVTHYHPAAVGPCVSSRGRRQDQLTVLVTLPDAGGGNQKHETFTFTSTECDKKLMSVSSTSGVSR